MKVRSIATAALGVCALLFAFIPTLAQSAGTTMYVKVDSTSPDAVVQSSTDFFEAEPMGRLEWNQEVEMLAETDGEYVKIRCNIEGKQVEGWVKSLVLSRAPQLTRPKAANGPVLSAAHGGVGRPIEYYIRADSPEMDAALERIDEFEAFLNRRLSGDAKEPDAVERNRMIKEFFPNAPLQPGSMK
ncbi:MAG: hypothetical protein R3E76_09320 [Planctomycetota bacterium]